MNITEQHAANDSALDEKLNAYQAEFEGLGEKQQKEFEALQVKHEKETAEVSEKLQASDAKAREDHRVEFDRINAEADKAHEAEIDKEQAAQVEASESHSAEALLVESMKGMTAEEIADEFNKTREVIPAAKYLGVSHSGNELAIAKRIIKALS